MSLSTRQCGLGLILWAAWIALGGNRADAGYVSAVKWSGGRTGARYVLALSGQDMGGLLSPLAKQQASAGGAGIGEPSRPQSHTDGRHPPPRPSSPVRKLPFAAYGLSHGGGAGNSSRSTSGDGPSSPRECDPPHPQVPSPEFTALLLLPTDAAHPFSPSSSIFHPPRAL